MKKIRLNKFLAERLGISRREADDIIANKKVKIGDKVAILGDRVDDNDKVWYNNKLISFMVDFLYLAMNKPTGYICSRRRQGENETIYSLLPTKYQELKTVGRLDKDSCGLILLTNDGDFAFEMTHPKFIKYKDYLVRLDRDLAPLHQQMIADFGITLKDGKSKMELERVGERRDFWKVTISEGRNRQIRRTFGALGYSVEFLQRIKFGKYEIGKLEEGKFEVIKP